MAARHRAGEKRKKHDHYKNPMSLEDDKQDLDENSPVIQAFRGFRQELDEKHDKYERLVKLSRDVTIESKRAIFSLQRLAGNESSQENILEEVSKKIQDIQQEKFKRIAKELHGEQPHQYARAYSPGLQEYIEAVSFYLYNKEGTLISLENVKNNLVFEEMEEDVSVSSDADVHPALITQTYSVYVSPVDYMLGVADLTGELMRCAITSVANGNLERPFQLCNFMRQIHDAFLGFTYLSRALSRKFTVLKQSLQKVENACYTLQVRGSEFPKHMLVDMMMHLQNKPSEPNYDGDHVNFSDEE